MQTRENLEELKPRRDVRFKAKEEKWPKSMGQNITYKRDRNSWIAACLRSSLLLMEGKKDVGMSLSCQMSRVEEEEEIV